MRIGGWIFAGVAAFFGLIAAVYWFGSYEDAGSLMLLSCAGLGVIFGGYLLWRTRRLPVAGESYAQPDRLVPGHPRPADHADDRGQACAERVGT